MKKEFTAPKVTSIGVSTEQIIAASKPIIVPKPYEYNSKDWTSTGSHSVSEIWGMSGRDILLNTETGEYILRQDQNGEWWEQIWGYITFQKSHDYMGCFTFGGDPYNTTGLVPGQKYHLYEAENGSGYYYLPCTD